MEEGYRQVFVIPAEGGTPRQITTGNYDHSDQHWLADGQHLVVASNRKED